MGVTPHASAQQKAVAFVTPQQAASDPDFSTQGEYVTPADVTPRKGMQIVALGDGLFRVVIYTGGLPGAGWDHNIPQVLENEDTEVVHDLLESVNAQKVSRESPTLGAKPPQGAVVLFDGTPETLKEHWQSGARITDDGLLQEGATTRQVFRDYHLHLEFRTPYMPAARGQQRGNSGVYHQARYETQILDSFGLKGLNNELGGIYTVRDPDVNMALPPLTWQTYDVTFTAARWDDAGKKIADARLIVRLNGVVVQPDIAVPGPTRGAKLDESPEPGPLYLQDHNNPVRFRNIWVVPRDADQEALRPRIPGYERFHALSGDPLDGGRVLVGELGCLNCHQGSEVQQTEVLSKQAPVLTDVGSRVRPEWMAQFIANPHKTKPGTTMPNLFTGWTDADREEAVEALVNFLASTGRLQERLPERRFVSAGEKLFHTVGCVACHPPDQGTPVPSATSIPLDGLAAKYTIPSLTEFLKNPHAVRPSGRMPSLNLQGEEPQEIAHYLLRQELDTRAPNVRYWVYHGNWSNLPDFDQLKPVAQGTCVGFDLSVAGQDDNYGIRFEAFINKEPRGTYIFQMGSDDGARLFIDGEPVIETDGIHPVQITQKTGRLEDSGPHAIRLDYFEAQGDEGLSVEFGRQGSPLNDLASALRLSVDDENESDKKTDIKRFRPNPKLVSRGRELFVSLGCANCHDLKVKDQLLKSRQTAPPFDRLSTDSGCLAEQPQSAQDAAVPDFDLVDGQRRDLAVYLATGSENRVLSPQQTIDYTLTAFNCYACHARNGKGGPESGRNALFTSTQIEMGDEGRIPPPLDGVGDKLQEDWLKTVLDQGANNRPYMKTRMPRFGGKNVGHLAAAFVSLDQHNDAKLAEFEEPLHRVRSTGRQLVGNGGLACIKCHTFADKAATGIQAISLTGMTQRLRADWFLRYLYEPARYRPGTRMPTGFPDGKAVVRDVYDGDPNKQISAIWIYLSQGESAGIPEGLVAETIELIPEDAPIIYRNFIEGVSPRAIAIGYPEKANLAWDADELCLRLIWHDRFIDASMHWVGRGAGNQRPLGDHVFTLEPTVPFAQLESRDAAWPTTSVRQREGFQFLGYTLDDQGEPTFSYRTPFGVIDDFPQPVQKNEREGTFRRELTVRCDEKTENLYFRAAIGKKIEQQDEGYRIDGVMTIRITGGQEPFIRESAGKQELLVPLQPEKNGSVQLTQEILW